MTQISVIIQTESWNESLRANLESLACQTLEYPDFEVLLTTHTADPLEAGLTRMALPYSCRLIRLAEGGSGANLYQGVEATTGRFCLFLKEDQITAPGLLAEHLQVQLETEGVVGIGRVIFNPRPGSSWYANQSCSWKNRQVDAWVKGEPPITWIDCLDQNFCASRQALLSNLPQSPHLESESGDGTAEIEIAFRLVRDGLRCEYIPGAVCKYEESRDFPTLAKKIMQRGSAYINLWRRQPAMLPELFGNFYDTSIRAIMLRHFLLWLRLSPLFLGMLGSLLQEKVWAKEWFKFLQSYCFWYGVKQALPDRSIWQRLTYGTPILMYHAFSSTGERASRYILPQHRFTQQMALLKLLGYQTITLEEYLDYLTTYRLVPERSLVITIDDGYLDNFQLALPVLHRFGFKATIFTVSDGLGGSNNWDDGSPLTGRLMMSALQARELQYTGISLGSHTCSHPKLTEISLEKSWEEIYRSKTEMEREFGASVQTFAYPHGSYNPSILDQVKHAGYLGACSVKRGLNTSAAPQFELYRTEVFGSTSLFQFLISVWSG